MKAIVQYSYGSPDVLELQEFEKPTVRDNEVLLQVRGASVNPLDWHFMRGRPLIMRMMGLGIFKPKRHILGVDVAGRIEAVGKAVTRFKPNDEVFGWHDGTLAEYAAVSEDTLVPKPSNLTFEQAATVPTAALTALQGLRNKGQVQPGQNILIIGASGGVGTFAVQIAKAYGAEVTGVCSTGNQEMVRSIGADHVIDYTQEDFTRSGQRYDLVFQLAGTDLPSKCRRVLTPKGTLVLSNGTGRLSGLDRLIAALVLSLFVSQTLCTFVTANTLEDMIVLKELIEAGKVTPVIDRSHPLEETPEAIRYLEEGHARGKVGITIGRESY